MNNYAKNIPRDKGGAPMDGLPANYLSLARSDNENAVVSSVITLTDNTTAIEITAVGAPVVMRWVGAGDTQASVISAAGTANFDHVISSGVLRRFVVPIESMPSSSIVGANVQNGLYKRVAVKSITIASVLTSEF